MHIPIKISTSILIFVLIILGGYTIYNFFIHKIDSTDYMGVGDSFLEKHQYSEAFTNYKKGEDKDPSNKDYYLKISQIYELKNRYQDAIKELNSGIGKTSQDTSLYFQIGKNCLYYYLIDPSYIDNGIFAFDKASKENDIKNEALYYEARLLTIKTGNDNLQKAKDIYSSLGDFQPAKLELLFFDINTPANIIKDINDAQNAIVDNNIKPDGFSNWSDFSTTIKSEYTSLQNDLASNNSVVIDNAKGYFAYKTNRCEFGIDNLQNAIKEAEKVSFYPQARIVLGECLKRLNLFSEAQSYLEPVYNNDKTNIDVRLILRQVYKGIKDYTKMTKIYDELIALDGQNIQTRLDYARDLELIPNWSQSAIQYTWLGNNLTQQSVLEDQKNTDLNLNKKYILQAYEIYAYKVQDFNSADALINNIKIKNVLTKDEADELIMWDKYESGDKNVENDLITKSCSLDNPDANYHCAILSSKKGDSQKAKDKALSAYDNDQYGYLSDLTFQILNGI